MEMHTDIELYSIMGENREALRGNEVNFLASCEKRLVVQKRGLSYGMRKWANSIVARLIRVETNAAAVEAAQLPDLKGIYGLFENVGDKLKYPKITFETESLGKVRIQRAGERSKYTGTLNITDGGPFGSNKWYGRVNLDGTFTAGRELLTDGMAKFLKDFSKDPVRMAKQYGEESGNCCFCHRKLTDKRSTDAGYGPVCADNYELPWGADK